MAVVGTRRGSPHPLFTDDSMIRRVHSEAIVLVGGGRALLMQIAHPAVAAGVAEHSNFQAAPFRRLVRTLQPTLAMAFGEPHEVEAAASAINRVHRRVRGPGYSATEPELLFWVLATLIDSALRVHGRFLRPLPPEDAEAYYQDMLTLGELLGVRRDLAPADIAGFRSYVKDMVQRIEVSPAGRRIARDIFGPPLIYTPAGPLMKEITAGLLPEPLRCQFGFSWGPGRERALSLLAGTTRRWLPRVPPRLRAHPWFLMPPSRRPLLLRRLAPSPGR
jgi:uncharacterized protein (DUF2236 family)